MTEIMKNIDVTKPHYVIDYTGEMGEIGIIVEVEVLMVKSGTATVKYSDSGEILVLSEDSLYTSKEEANESLNKSDT
jgi:hypothetical protein